MRSLARTAQSLSGEGQATRQDVQVPGLRVQHVALDCDWHPGRRIVFFRATDDLTPRRIRGGTGRQRLVFNPKAKKTAPYEISYCQHAALEWQFLYPDGHWFCA